MWSFQEKVKLVDSERSKLLFGGIFFWKISYTCWIILLDLVASMKPYARLLGELLGELENKLKSFAKKFNEILEAQADASALEHDPSQSLS